MMTMLSITALFPSLAGWAGTLSYLAAYFLLSINKLKANQATYHVLNIVGAVGLTYNALVLKDYPNIIVNVCWTIIRRERMAEIDGIPLIGELSAIQPNAVLRDGKLVVTWKAIKNKGQAKVFVATSNRFKEGRQDDYVLMATVPVAKQEAVIDVSNKSDTFYKVFIETPDNYLNRWVIVK